MEKIQIQFKESDYKVYYEYCLKYYQAHEIVRKQSLHAFLDLFEKGIIPVEEQDIQQARQLLSDKCNDLKNEHNGSSRERDTILFQMRVCSDILLLIDDLEKIYRLIQKQGVVANYLMILGTFSKIIEENKHSEVFGRYNLKSNVIESLAGPLADSIRTRLGTDRNWQSALRELTFIASRFNQRASEPKFDLDIIKLIAPAVVSHFNKNVEIREILAVLPSYFEESELEEFEAFLNKTPDILKDDQEADINWEAIDAPLNVVAAAVAAQRDKWTQERMIIADPYSTVSPVVTRSADELIPAGLPSSSYPVLQQTGGYKKFDLAVGPHSASQVDSPLKVNPLPESAPKLPGFHPFLPVIIGIAVIILFIMGTMVVSGDWDLSGAGNATNSTTGINKSATAIKSAASPAPKATTAKPVTTPVPKATTAKIIVTPTPSSTPQSYSSVDIGNHLVEIAFGPDNNNIQKYQKELMAISFSSRYDDSDIELMHDFINKFNVLSTTSKMSENVILTGQGDIQLDFLPGDSMNQISTDAKTSVSRDLQSGTYYFIRTGEKTYVNSDLKGDERKRWVLRALLYNLGFYGETAKYPDSLFYSGTTKASGLSAIDMKAVQLMYGKKITNGMTKSSVKVTF